MKSWLMVLGIVLADATGNMALRRGMQQIGDVTCCRLEEVPGLIKRLVRNRILGMGVACMALAFVLFLTMLSWADLSFALPATALGAVVNALGARIFLKENVTIERWIGTLLICGGVALLGRAG